MCVKQLRNAGAKDAFDKEATLAWQLRDQPYFVSLLGVCEEAAALVMERVNGPSLETFLSSVKLTDTVRWALITQIAEGMRQLHAKGVIHRDLKPSNVLLTTAEPTDQDAVRSHRT